MPIKAFIFRSGFFRSRLKLRLSERALMRPSCASHFEEQLDAALAGSLKCTLRKAKSPFRHIDLLLPVYTLL